MLAHVLVVALAASLGASSTFATDNETEAAALAALLRQLDAIERIANDASHSVHTSHARYHFDYARLKDDLARVRAGVENYLSPERAQPRDPELLAGAYRREGDAP
jgi:RAQPRD family integrative conjugative element protein